MKYTALFICVTLCVSKIYAQEPKFTVRVGGVDHTFEEDRPSLDFTNVLNGCATGVWVSYAAENYFDTTRIFSSTETYCPIPFIPQNVLRSVRFVGVLHNITATSATLFSEKSLSGAAVTFVNEIPRITFPVKSMVTIGTRVELFQNYNFQGPSVCLEIDFDYCNRNVCWDWELQRDDFDWDITSAKSAKAGCGCTTTLTRNYPKNGDGTIPS